MSEHPIPSVRESMLPDALVEVKIFERRRGDPSLETQINDWVNKTGNLLVIPGPITSNESSASMAITYLPASRKHHDGKAKPKQEPAKDRVEGPAAEGGDQENQTKTKADVGSDSRPASGGRPRSLAILSDGSMPGSRKS